VHIRVSQTEPTVRVIAEAREEAVAEELRREYVIKVKRSI
jgi:phosphomannomutase